MDASYPPFNDWALDPVLSGANQDEEEYDSRIVLSLRNANLAGYTDSSSTRVNFMNLWADGGMATVPPEFFDPSAICEQTSYNNGYDPPPTEAAFPFVNLQDQETFADTIGPCLPHTLEENL